jgi:hypothetical protein
MSYAYDPKSCSELEKTLYTPIEAAIRWCGLFEYEDYILSELRERVTPTASMFKQWPCLQVNVAKIFDAALGGLLPFIGDGSITRVSHHFVSPSNEKDSPPYFAKYPSPLIANLTVRHSDLKEWMAKYFPDQKPAFLFDEVERNTHAAINADTFRALQADRDALKTQLANYTKWYENTTKKLDISQKELNKLKANNKILGDRERRANEILVGALLECIFSKSGFKDTNVFDSNAKLIEKLANDYRDFEGMAERTLQEKFAAAKKSLSVQD